MAVDEPGDDRAAAGVDLDVRVRRVGSGADPGDPCALEDDGGVADDAQEATLLGARRRRW